MATIRKNFATDGETNCAGMKWTEIKQFQHRYIVDIPSDFERNLLVETELPSPTFDPVHVANHNIYRELFKPKPKLDTRLAYFRKLYARSNKNVYKKLVKKHEYAELPQYVVDVASGAFDDNEDHTWYYTGGTLDCVSFNDKTCIVKAGLQQAIQIVDLYEPTTTAYIKLEEDTPVYNLKSVSYAQDAFLVVRQKCKLSLFRLCYNNTGLNTELIWKNKTSNSTFVDMSVNNSKRNEIAAIDASHSLKVKDFVKNKSVVNYNFATNDCNDNFAQIMYVDCSTLAFINRCCIYLLDLRSLNVQKTCLKTGWLKCDDLCTFSQTSNNENCIYVSSIHNVAKLDVRLLKCHNKVMHMLSAPPFISSCITDDDREYICLSSQNITDKVLLHTSSNFLSTPVYIPNTKDTLATASLIKRLNMSDYLDERLSLPTLGIKLWKDSASNGINLFALNSVGDVFQQKLLQTKPDHTAAVNRLVEWSDVLSYKPKILEATSICNLSNIMHNVSTCFSEARILTTLMKENRSQQQFEKEFCGLTKYLEGSVGEAMNSIWDIQKIVTESEVDVASEVSSKSKVSEWLASTGGN